MLTALDSMGFPAKFLIWIKECISTPMFLVKVNGQLEGFLKEKKGLRQGDPSSPYLFIVCMEVLSQLLHKATTKGKIYVHPKCAKLKLSHLSFVDDLLLFYNASLSSLQGINYVMTEFQQLSGLGVNYNKSELYCSGISDELKCQLPAIIGVKLGYLSVRYLGVPLFSGKLTIKDCALIIDKITGMIKAWTSRFLSFVSRL